MVYREVVPVSEEISISMVLQQQVSFVERLSIPQRVPYRRFHCNTVGIAGAHNCLWLTVWVNNGGQLLHPRIIQVHGDVEIKVVLECKRPAAIGSVHVVKILQIGNMKSLNNGHKNNKEIHSMAMYIYISSTVIVMWS